MIRTYLLFLCVVCVCLALFDHLNRKFVEVIKVVRSVRDFVTVNTHELQILHDGFFELALQKVCQSSVPTLNPSVHTHPLLRRVGIIETDDHFALIHLGKVLVEERSFGMANVQITRRLRWESGDNLTLDGILQTKCKAGGSLVVAGLASLRSSQVGDDGLS